MPQILVRRPSPHPDGMSVIEWEKLQGCVTCPSVRIRTAPAAAVPA